ncbi:uncharacterized protein LOC134812684 isoform X2 [Bolinopsis microptera]|uniref:uncharacterized protein LOC134812684 isoform X2 n=1 Tax=Bolinopsis microptera TaxID=2820187 RepID=UPI0030796B89
MKAKAWPEEKLLEFPHIKFHHPSCNNYVYINGQKFPSLPKNDRGRTCSFHKDLPEFITSQYTAFSYIRKEERCILCKNFRLGSDSRDVHVKCESTRPKNDSNIHGSKVLPLKIHKAVTYLTSNRQTDAGARSYSTPATRGTSTRMQNTISRISNPRRCKTRVSYTSPSRLSTRESTKGRQGSMRSSLDFSIAQSRGSNDSSFPPLYKDESVISPSYCRKFNSPVEHYQPIVKIDCLLGSMKSAMNPVYI